MILLKVPILGDLVDLLANIMGYIMQFLFFITGGHNIGLCIILFTIIVRLLMLPMTIKQQKSSKLSAIMQPELEAIREKYKGKTDQNSMMKMQEETRAVYTKYGTSTAGGCLQLFIQLPIFYGIFAVVRNIPKYVPSVKALFTPVIDGLSGIANFGETLTESGILTSSQMVNTDFTKADTLLALLNTFSTEQWNKLSEIFPSISNVIAESSEKIIHINNFLGINLATEPGFRLSIALIIPILAGITQWLQMKLMPQANQNSDDDDSAAGSMAQSMKMMNNIMPIISAVFCISMPAGLGLYWIMGSVVQCIMQFFINREMDKIDIEELAKKNIEKANEKRAKKGLPPNKVNTHAAAEHYKETIARKENEIASRGERAKQIADSTQYYNQNAKPGSLASKVNMVKMYNEKNSTDKGSSNK